MALSTALGTGAWRNLFSVSMPEVTTNWADGGLELFQAVCTMVLPYILLFFIIGWIHGMRPAGVQIGVEKAAAQEFRFQKVLT